MKPDPQQMKAFFDATNKIAHLVGTGQIEKAVVSLDDLANALEEMDRKNKLKPISTPAEPDTGQWQEAK